MVVHLKPETESRLRELSATTGRAPDELVEDAMAGYLEELAQLRATLDSRYDGIKNGRIKPLDGEEAFNHLRNKSKDRRTIAPDTTTRHLADSLAKTQRAMTSQAFTLTSEEILSYGKTHSAFGSVAKGRIARV